MFNYVIGFSWDYFFFFYRNYRNHNSSVLKDISNDKSILIYFSSSDCSYCSHVEEVLKYKKIKYSDYDIDSSFDYDDLLQKIGISKSNLKVPALVYIRKGKMFSNIVGITDEESVLDFLDHFSVSNGLS